MTIGLDLRMLDGGSGVSRYVQELSLAVLKSDKKNKYVLFFEKITPELDRLYRPFGQAMVATGIKHYSFAEQFRLPFVLLKHKLDLVHFPHFNVPLLYRKKFVVTIHDLTHSKFPGRKKSRFFHRIAYNLVLANALRWANKVIAVSNSTKQEVVDYFGLDPQKIQVIYEGVTATYGMTHKDEAQAKVLRDFKIDKPYILYVGVWRRYKNLPMLAQAFSAIAEKYDYNLVLAGAEDPFYPEIKGQIMAVRNAKRIHTLGRVSDSELNNLYNAAEILALPSLHEGFGLTVLEAAACGTAVACSDIPTLREVMGQAAEYFDPLNLQNMIDVFSSLIEDPKKREELANLGLARVRHFDWKTAALETINIYAEAIE